MKVLIVDDEPNILDIVEAYLAAKKYQVYRAESGAEALEVVLLGPAEVSLSTPGSRR